MMKNAKISLTLFLILMIALPKFSAVQTKISVLSGSKRTIKEVLSLVEEKMKTGSPLNKIMQLLDELKNDILEEQSRHEVLANNQRSECSDETQFRSKQIEDAEQALNSASSRKRSCEIENEKSRAELKTNKQNQDNTKNMLLLLDEEKTATAEEKAIRQKDHLAAQQTIDESLELIDELASGLGASSPNFLQQISKLATGLLETGVKVSGGKHYVDALSSIAFISSKPDLLSNSEDIDKVKSLLSKVRENINISWENHLAEYKISEERFDFLKNNLDGTLATLEENQRELSDQILAMEQCIHAQGLVVQASEEKKARNSGLLDSANKMCENFEHEFKLSSDARKMEQELIDNVKRVVDDRFKQLSSKVVTSFVSKEWSPYHRETSNISGSTSML